MPKNTLISDDADLIAVSNYIEDQRANIPHFPALQAKIEDFERWYQALGWWDLHGNMTGTFAEAVRRRDEINQIENNVLDPSWVPADKINMTPGNAGLPGPKPPLIPEKYKMAAIIAGAVTLTLIVAKKIVFPFI